MDRSLRVLLQSFLLFAGIFSVGGCAEYNRVPTVSEANSLSGITQLTGGFIGSGEASFSRDLRWIVFRAVPIGQQQFQVYVAKTVSSEGEITGTERPISVTPAGTRGGSGCFSPDSSSLIFACTAPQAAVGRFPHNMRIFRVDGWEEMVGMVQATKGLDLAQNLLADNPPYNGECSYSPDGRWICFTSGRNGNPNLYVMHADGTHVVQITKTDGYDGAASFSPNGKSLVYQSERDSTHDRQIYVGDLSFDRAGEITGLAAERAITHEDSNVNPSWHPDGQHIIYSSSRQGKNNYELYLMDRSGYSKTRITFFPGADLFPTFSPDGRYLMWTSKRAPDGTTEVFFAKFKFPRGS